MLKTFSPISVISASGNVLRSGLSAQASTIRLYRSFSKDFPKTMFSRRVLFWIQACWGTYDIDSWVKRQPSMIYQFIVFLYTGPYFVSYPKDNLSFFEHHVAKKRRNEGWFSASNLTDHRKQLTILDSQRNATDGWPGKFAFLAITCIVKSKDIRILSQYGWTI